MCLHNKKNEHLFNSCFHVLREPPTVVNIKYTFTQILNTTLSNQSQYALTSTRKA